MIFPVRIIERFYPKISINKNGCWIWTGKVQSKGYGELSTGSWKTSNRVVYRAHRLSYLIHVGDIPEGMHVCHTCDVRLCVNPDHLWVGTNHDNVLDCHAKGRRRYQKST
jgi:hypothetical protein